MSVPGVPQDLPRPGFVGRAFRVTLGLLLLAWLAWGLAAYLADSARWPLPLLLTLPVALYFLGDVFSIGFGRTWGRKPLVAALTLLLLSLAGDLLLTGHLGAAPSGVALLLISGGSLLYGGLAYLIAAVVAAPG